jgi:16S rRNA (uracil1498-N3)-methyltransferase
MIEKVTAGQPESPLQLSLAMALVKGEKFDLVVQKTTELGVTRIVPTVVARSDLRLRNTEERNSRLERWRRIALEAAKQSGRAFIPEISAPVTFDNLIRATVTESGIRILFAEHGGTAFTDLATRPPHLLALIGPEGGWTSTELDLATEHGWQIITLGGRTLRAETAAIAITALLQHRFGDLV